MRKIFILFFTIVFSFANAQDIALKDIKVLIEQNGKAIEQNGKAIEQNGKAIEQNGETIEQNGKKIELLDARIDNVEKRLDFMQNIIYIVLATVIGLPLYLDGRRNRNDEELSKAKDKIKEITLVLKELAQDDPKIKRSIDIVGL